MNVERLRAVQAEEREADSLRALPDTFYREVADYIEELRAKRAQAAEVADDPFDSAEVRRLTSEIKDVEELAEAIYERRVGKLVKQASLAAAGVPADEEGLTSEEAELFSDLVAQIEAHRTAVLASFDGDRGERDSNDDAAGTGTPLDTGDETGRDENGGAEATIDASEAMGGRGQEAEPQPAADPAEAPPPPSDEPSEDMDATTGGDDHDPEDADGDEAESTDGGEPERVTLRITRDVGEVFGVDERVYDLATEDVVTLPAANAKPLLDRDAAEKVE